MHKVRATSDFIRSYKRLLKKKGDFKQRVERVFRELAINPFNPALKTHRLSGKFKDEYSCSAGYDLRIIFNIMPNAAGQESDVLLLDIGTHDEVY